MRFEIQGRDLGSNRASNLRRLKPLVGYIFLPLHVDDVDHDSSPADAVVQCTRSTGKTCYKYKISCHKTIGNYSRMNVNVL